MKLRPARCRASAGWSASSTTKPRRSRFPASLPLSPPGISTTACPRCSSACCSTRVERPSSKTCARTIAHAQRCHGPDRFPVRVERATLRYAFLDVVYARDPRLRAEAVDAAIRAALGLAGDGEHERTGLFGLRARRLGDVEYASRIEARIQNVAGVVWCRVTGFDLFDPPVPPAIAVDPVEPRARAGAALRSSRSRRVRRTSCCNWRRSI